MCYGVEPIYNIQDRSERPGISREYGKEPNRVEESSQQGRGLRLHSKDLPVDRSGESATPVWPRLRQSGRVLLDRLRLLLDHPRLLLDHLRLPIHPIRPIRCPLPPAPSHRVRS